VHQLKKLVAVDFPDAEKIVLAHDKLEIHMSRHGIKLAIKLQVKSTGGLPQKIQRLNFIGYIHYL